MDFSKFDNRGPAEAGQRLEFRDPSVQDGEVLMEGKKACAAIIRGSTARSVQAASRARRKAKIAEGDDAIEIMEDVHEDLCEQAADLIVSFENIERDGKPLTNSPEDIKWFLDLTFPVMETKKTKDGKPLLVDGKMQFEMVNNPLAKQITAFSAEMARKLGNGQTS